MDKQNKSNWKKCRANFKVIDIFGNYQDNMIVGESQELQVNSAVLDVIEKEVM